MNKIIQLPESLINQIAAGEVIERPASIVKELLENSIDAGATKITILLEEGGKDKIVIIDNGNGMSKGDIQNCFKKHNTSKLSNIRDLFNISTLGFRGEALSSISTVSRLSIESSIPQYNGVGYKIVTTENKLLEEPIKVGRPTGTTIMVEKVFYNTPARRKHLKSSRVELTHIIDVVRKFSLLHPNIAFNLEQKGKNYIRTNGNNNLLQVISEVYGRNDLNSFKEINIDTDYIKVSGFITNTDGVRKSKRNQVIGVNGRWIENTELYKEVENSYRKYIPPGVFPQFIIDIRLNERFVDNNIHPQKMRVRFQKEDLVYNTLRKALHNVLKPTTIEKDTDEEYLLHEPLGDIQSAINIDIIGQLKDTYILCEVNDKLLIVDQHAAHEAIIYHYLKESVLKDRYIMNRIILDKPAIIELTGLQESQLDKHLPEIQKMGFLIERFGEKTIIVREAPEGVNPEEISGLISDMLTSGVNNKNNWLENTLVNTSCKSAIKANQTLNNEVMTYLIKELILNQLTNCPHGRPLYTTTGINELHKKFKRIL